MMGALYKTKKDLKLAIGQPLQCISHTQTPPVRHWYWKHSIRSITNLTTGGHASCTRISTSQAKSC